MYTYPLQTLMKDGFQFELERLEKRNQQWARNKRWLFQAVTLATSWASAEVISKLPEGSGCSSPHLQIPSLIGISLRSLSFWDLPSVFISQALWKSPPWEAEAEFRQITI